MAFNELSGSVEGDAEIDAALSGLFALSGSMIGVAETVGLGLLERVNREGHPIPGRGNAHPIPGRTEEE